MSTSAQPTRILHPDAEWTFCPICKIALNVWMLREGDDKFVYPYTAVDSQVADPAFSPGAQPGETNLHYRLRMHLAAHARTPPAPRRRRRGRSPEFEREARYAYVLYAQPDPKDRRRVLPSAVTLWKEGVDETPGPLPGMKEIERGYMASYNDGPQVIMRKQRQLERNREYVRKHRAKRANPR